MVSNLADFLSIDFSNFFFVMAATTLLDNRTLKNLLLTTAIKGAGTRITCTFYKTAKLLKFTAVKMDSDDIFIESNKDRKKRDKTEFQQEQSAIENKIRSLRRTYQTVIEKCRILGVDRMLTLTFKENVTDIDQANLAFSEFVRLARKKFGTFEYICVPEKQKRGAIHFHLGLSKFYQWYTLLALWRLAINKSGINSAAKSENCGGIFINKTLCTGSVNRMSKYIAKYILKGIENAKNDIDVNAFAVGKKRYYVSKGIEQAVKIKVYTTIPIGHWFMHDIRHGIAEFFIEKTAILRKESEYFFKDWKFRDSEQYFFVHN